MAGSVNKVILVGRVGKDPEIKSFSNGGKVANFSLATSDVWRDKQSGEKKERTEWSRVAVFSEGLVSIVEKYVKKGALLYIEGSLATRKYTDQSGVERYSTEVVLQTYNGTLTMLDGPKGRTDDVQEGNYGFGAGEPEEKRPASRASFDKKIEDEIPF